MNLENRLVDSSTRRLVILCFANLAFVGSAFALTSSDVHDCVAADAPGGADTCGIASTRFACGVSGSLKFVCDLSICDGASTITVVTKYGSSTREFSAWGTCNTETFCCAMEDTSEEATDLIVTGSDYNDVIKFTYSSYNLTALDTEAPLVGWVGGQDGHDVIQGSDSASEYYRDMLFGGDDPDLMHAMDGFIDCSWGDQGNDEMYGDPGADWMWGGLGIDSMWGGNDADSLHDECQGNSSNKTFFQGGPGTDQLVYLWDGSCDADDVLDSASTCDTSVNISNSDVFFEVDGYQGLISHCETAGTGAPEECTIDDCNSEEVFVPPSAEFEE